MRLRDVQPGDVDAYIAMRCDPQMMQYLGGPRPRDTIADKVRRDVAAVTAGTSWICMIVAGDDPGVVAGTVTLWSNAGHGAAESEIGWMVLPEFQGQGLAKAAVCVLLARAWHDTRWGTVHAYPAVSNAASNSVCRSVGFSLAGEQDLDYAGQRLRVNHWLIDPAADLDAATNLDAAIGPATDPASA